MKWKLYSKRALRRAISCLLLSIFLILLVNTQYHKLPDVLMIQFMLLAAFALIAAVWLGITAFTKELARDERLREDERYQMVQQKSGNIAFQISFWAIAAIQVGLVLAYYIWDLEFLSPYLLTISCITFLMLLVNGITESILEKRL